MCLKDKALSLDERMCIEYRVKQGIPNVSCRGDEPCMTCSYMEICAFADPDFSCDSKYKCTVVEDGFINCTKDGDNFFTKNCTSSLLYCRQLNNYKDIRKCGKGESLISDFKGKMITQWTLLDNKSTLSKPELD